MNYPCETQNLELACFALRHDVEHKLKSGDVFKHHGVKWLVVTVSNPTCLIWLKQQSPEQWFEMFGTTRNMFVVQEQLVRVATLNNVHLMS